MLACMTYVYCMKKFSSALLLSVIVVFSGCSSQSPTNSSTSQELQKGDHIRVSTSFYPLYEIARQVGGDYVDVKNLVPPGAEPHDYELSPKDIAGIMDAKILVVNGAGLEPWLDKYLPDLQQSGIKVVDESKIIQNLIVSDPHIWLDPKKYMEEVNAFEQALATIDPAHTEYYHSRAQRYNGELASMDQEYQSGLQNCKSREFVTNHAAFGYLAKSYDLTMVAISGFSPDAEPSPKILAELSDLLHENNVKYILVETLVSPKIAETLAQEVGAQTLVINPLEGLTVDELAQGENYISVMQQNLKNLQTALDCR